MATGNCEHTKHGKTVVIAFDGSDYAKYAMKCKYWCRIR